MKPILFSGFLLVTFLLSHSTQAQKQSDLLLYRELDKKLDPGFKYISEEGGYTAIIKGRRSTFIKEIESKEGIINAYFLGGEVSKDLAYCVVYYLPPAGYTVYDDSTYLNNMALQLTATTASEAEIKNITFNGYPALTCVKQDLEKKLLMDILLVLRGARVYIVFVAGTREKVSQANVLQFYESFKFIPFKPAKWFSYEDKEEEIKWNVPGEVKKKTDTTYSAELPYEKSYNAIDTCSGISYAVNVSVYSPYFYMPSGDFSNNLQKYFVEKEDSIFQQNKRTVNGIIGIEFLIKQKNTHNQKRVFIIPHDNKLVQICARMPPEMIQSDVANKFFSSLSMTNSNAKTTIFESKAQQLLKDLSSKDSITYRDAFNMLYHYNFQPTEAQLIYTELQKKWKDDSLGYESVRAVLLSRLKDLEDTSTVSIIKELYPNLNKSPFLQVKALEVLLNSKSPSAKELLISLINKNIPAVDEIPYSFFDAMDHSLEWNKTLFPEIFTLVKNTPFRQGIYRSGNILLDSNGIRKDYFIPHLEQLLSYCKEDGKVAENYNVSYMNVWHAITLFGHFTDQEEIKSYLMLMSYHSDNALAYQALCELVKHKITVDPQILLRFAASNDYRISLYHLLKESDQLSLFPAKWYKQKYFAETDMYNFISDYDYEFYYEKIELINSKVINYKGVSSRFFLFKMLAKEEWYVGVSGPYDLDKHKVYSEGEATNSFYKTLKSRSVNEHYEQLLKLKEETK